MGRKPKKEELWRMLAEEMGGMLVTNKRGKPKGASFTTGPWIVVLDRYTQSHGESSQTYTRVRSAYRARDDLRFRIYRKSIFSGLGKAFGMQDLEIGMPEIDEAYIVQSNSIGKVQSMLLRREIAYPLKQLRTGKLQVRPRRRGLRETGWMDLIYETTAKADLERMRLMVKLVMSTIEHLGRTGTAAKEAVPVPIL